MDYFVGIMEKSRSDIKSVGDFFLVKTFTFRAFTGKSA